MQHEHLIAYLTAYRTIYPGVYLHKRLATCLPGRDVDDRSGLEGHGRPGRATPTFDSRFEKPPPGQSDGCTRNDRV